MHHSSSTSPPPSRRKPPSPLDTSSKRLSSQSGVLLYDLPNSAPSNPASPTSPSSPEKRIRHSRILSPSNANVQSRRRSYTPSGTNSADLEKFAEHCRSWYFDQSEESGKLMTKTLESLPASHRAPFIRLQASIRSSFHASINQRRQTEFLAHLSTVKCGHSLTPAARADPQSSTAQRERQDRFHKFCSAWCTAIYPGTRPFFEALWALMRLQILPENLGGAGDRLIQWELSDDVFIETAGKDFMLEALTVIKGVLGFTHDASKLEPTAVPTPASAPQPRRTSRIASTTTRSRSPPTSANPFLDDNIPISPPSRQLEELASDSEDLSHLVSDMIRQHSAASTAEVGVRLRTWTAPDLINPEYQALMRCFPSSVTRGLVPRFPTTRGADAAYNLEQGVRGEDKEISFGTGSMWISAIERDPDYIGSMWTRFILWVKRLFGSA